MLSFKTPNPPVPAVPKDKVRDSKGDIPVSNSNTTCTMVRKIYISYSILAVCFTLGTSFPTVGPGLSARIRCMLYPPARGNTAKISTSTPMPPIQWVKLRQNRLHFDSTSTLFKILAPVVVSPEIVSNSASV